MSNKRTKILERYSSILGKIIITVTIKTRSISNVRLLDQ